MNPYLSASHVRAALARLNIHPTRGMGQNFLIDGEVLQHIVEAAHLTRDDVVVEVGPGLGVLTWELVRHAGQVVSVELDKRLAARLDEEFARGTADMPTSLAPIHIMQGDVLQIPPAHMLEQVAGSSCSPLAYDGRYKIVANLPYAITSPVLRHFLEHPPHPSIMVVLVQWEVAQRITARPGKLSMLAHAITMYAEPEIVGRVGAKSFFPQPAIDSAILRLHTRPSPAVAVDDAYAFFQVIKAGFVQSRKKLANALPSGLASQGRVISRERAMAAMQTAGVSPDRRAETLTLDEWAAVYQQVCPLLAETT